MTFINDSLIIDNPGNIEIINKIGKREITHIIHDIDGTHSLIREWPPIMSLSIYWAMTSGLEEDFDSKENIQNLIKRVGTEKLEETDQFCIESAGLSALTQMEFGIRRAIENGNIPKNIEFKLSKKEMENNSNIIKRIWNGEEIFENINEQKSFLKFINNKTTRLFKLYENILNGACRDKNTAEAWINPEKWLVPGSMKFMNHLYNLGCVNYFVTGAVIYKEGGMFEEVKSLGFDIGKGKLIEALKGSSWNKKLPKNKVIKELFKELDINPSKALIIGDGRAEIEAGVMQGCITLSRLDTDMLRQRELHTGFGTNFIIPNFTSESLFTMINK